MQSTKDYSIFKKKISNRYLKEKHIEKLMAAIKMQNLLHLDPIKVNAEMEVMDGQHRLEAAKRLGAEIYYQQDENLSSSSMALLNNYQLKWTYEDWLHFYTMEGFEDYLKLTRFIKKNGTSLQNALAILGMHHSGKIMNKFKSGLFKFPSPSEELESLNKLSQIRQIVEFVYPKIFGEKKYLSGASFSRGLIAFLNVKSVDFDLFIKKLPWKLDLLRPCSRISDYVLIFREIYNYKNKNPLDKDSFDEYDTQ